MSVPSPAVTELIVGALGAVVTKFDVMTRLPVPLIETATNFSCPVGPPHTTENHAFSILEASLVQVMPSVLVMKRFPELIIEETATNFSCPACPPHTTEDHQSSVIGVVWLVQVMPSVLVIARFVVELPTPEPSATATNFSCPVAPPHVTELQGLSAAEVRDVQLMPSVLVMTRLPVPLIATATNIPFP